MKKKLILTIIIALVATACALAFSACDRGEATHPLNYDESGFEASGSLVAEGMTSLDVEWLAGEVRFEVVEELQTVELSERGASGKDETTTMRTLLDDGTLIVKCAAPGSYKLEGAIVKTLLVRVPKNFCFESVKITAYGANVYLPGVMAKRVDVDSHLGAVIMYTEASNMLTSPHKISLKSISGDVRLNLLDNVVQEEEGDGAVFVTSSSGDVEVKVNAFAPLLKVRTSSGHQDIELNVAVIELDIEATSGGIDMLSKVAPRKLVVDAICSLMHFKLNELDAFELVTDAELAVSLIDLSKREPMEDGNFKYVYEPQEYSGSRASFAIRGKNSVLHLEKIRT